MNYAKWNLINPNHTVSPLRFYMGAKEGVHCEGHSPFTISALPHPGSVLAGVNTHGDHILVVTVS